MKAEILGIKIDDVNLGEALKIVRNFLTKSGKYYITTPNPEIVMMAQKDADFKKIINNADLAVPDGAGLKLSSDIVCNTTGIDLMEGIIKLAADQGFTTGFLGGGEGVAKKTAECLLRKYPKLKISFVNSGGYINNKGEAENTIYDIPHTDLLFVAFGPPKQEKWIAKNLDKIPVKVAMGVGGSFDVLSGRVSRAPKWIRNLGFEWLFRLVIQPWRLKRQLALFKYLWLLTKHKR